MAQSEIFLSFWRILWLLALVLLVAWLGLIAVMYFRQAGYVFFPHKRIETTPTALGLKYEDVYFTTSDGERLNAWFVPSDIRRGIALIFHGNAGNIGDRLPAIESFHRLGMDVFIVDYRGFGLSSGAPSEKGTRLDALAAWECLVRDRGIRPESLLVVGRSLGGAVACRLAAEKEIGALVLEATFSSLPDLAAKIYPWLPARLLCRFKYDSINQIRAVTKPVLIAHSPADEMIPFRQAQALFEAANEPKYFYELTGGHNDGEAGMEPGYFRFLDEFIARHIAPLQEAAPQMPP